MVQTTASLWRVPFYLSYLIINFNYQYFGSQWSSQWVLLKKKEKGTVSKPSSMFCHLFFCKVHHQDHHLPSNKMVLTDAQLKLPRTHGPLFFLHYALISPLVYRSHLLSIKLITWDIHNNFFI